jgi:hypothetical protein
VAIKRLATARTGKTAGGESCDCNHYVAIAAAILFVTFGLH